MTWIDTFIICLSVGYLRFIGGFALGVFLANSVFRYDAIKRNVARYHPQTGKWEWTVEEKK